MNKRMYVETNKYRMLRVSRQLTTEHRTELLELVRRAYAAEKSLEHITAADGVFSLIQQEFSCGNIFYKEQR